MDEKITKKCASNDPNEAHLCAKVWDLCAKVWIIYYINVRQIVGCEKKCAIVALVRENKFIPPTLT